MVFVEVEGGVAAEADGGRTAAGKACVGVALTVVVEAMVVQRRWRWLWIREGFLRTAMASASSHSIFFVVWVF